MNNALDQNIHAVFTLLIVAIAWIIHHMYEIWTDERKDNARGLGIEARQGILRNEAVGDESGMDPAFREGQGGHRKRSA